MEIIRICQGGEEVIPEVVFLKKYNAVKKRRQYNQPLKHGSQKQISAVRQTQGGVSNSHPQNKISDRDRELNEVLLQVMRRKNILQHQFKILTETAINT